MKTVSSGFRKTDTAYAFMIAGKKSSNTIHNVKEPGIYHWRCHQHSQII